MKRRPPTRTLRERPDLEQLRRQAKELLRAFAAGETAAAAEVTAHLHDADRASFALHDAQFVLARSYGFDSWPKLKAFVDGVTVRRLAEAVERGDARRVRAMLKARPELVNFDMAENDERRAIHFAVFARDAAMVRLLMRLGADARAGIYPHRPATTALTIAREREYGEIAAIIEEEERRRPEQPRARFEEERQTDAEAAIERGDAEWLRARHSEGKLEPGVLTTAVEADRPDMLGVLLDLGFDPNEPTRVENVEEVVHSAGAPLWACAAGGKIEMARVLLDRGADPNVQVYASGSAIYSAYRQGQMEMVELLKQHGGRVTGDIVGSFRLKDLAREMVANGTAAEIQDLLWTAADSGDVEIVAMALPRIDWGREDDRWYWVLMQAVWAASPECLRMLVERCDPNLRHTKFGRTILHEVAGLGGGKTEARSGELAAVLLDAGARMDIRDDLLKSTPLGWACRWGRLGMARVLLDRGADRTEADAEEWARPRAWAARMGHAEVLEALG